MYFESRKQAGELLAKQLYDRYYKKNCFVLALSSGSVLVAEQIAKSLSCKLSLLLIEEIEVPGEGVNFGGVSEGGDFTYNSMLSQGEIDDYTSEYHGYLDDKKREIFEKLNKMSNDLGILNNDMLRDKVIILVADGFKTGSSIDVAVEYLKPIRVERIIVAAPVSTIEASDRLHLLTDEVHILDLKSNYMGRDHYYSQNILPSHEEAIKKIKDFNNI